MAIKLMFKELVDVTKEIAKDFMDMEKCPGDRPFRPARYDRYKNIIEEDPQLFHPPTWAAAEYNGVQYRINGKHTSTLFFNEKIPAGQSVLALWYKCTEAADLATLYAQYDSFTGVRTAKDIYQTCAAIEPSLSKLTGRVIELAATGLAYHYWEEEQKKYDAVERGELMIDHVDFCLFLHETLYEKQDGLTEQKILRRAPVTAAMARTYLKNRKAAREFWMNLSQGNKDHPGRTLEYFLLDHSVMHGRGGQNGKHPVSPREMFAKCIYAWNAWRKGETRSNLVYSATNDLPKAS